MGIVNDKFYPQLSLDKEDDFSSPLKLLARSVSFKDPLTGRELCFISEREL
jgi:tRNA pseudouridine32 synthase/23S rRNA pseudouridine746 synthase